MFRIESYITPIILSYVDKYVKNIRPEDSQMSLWGGDVQFQNLDLRLDVLEEELNLPFSFLSGHIHELTIRVPWTKIASEPVCVTINTIEFVLKLKEADNGSPTSDREGQGKTKKKKISRYEESANTSPSGYMASLVNKITNNISIQCHNIIFKYVEEDLVMSMNIQLLSINTADNNWNPAFVDTSPTKVVMKKIVEISDLTICLDKRNEAGKIEMCQEPILYRCSMKLHLLRRYNVSTSHKASILRVDLKSEAIHLNISSLQFPMVIRLFNLLQALKNGSLEKRLQVYGGPQTAESNDNLTLDGEGLISWAWNLLPTIFPEDAVSDSSEEINEHIVHFGFFIKDIQVTVKNQEPVSDMIVNGTKKLKYQPLLRLQFHGCRGTSIGVGKRWSTFQGSINHIDMVPFENCVCGQSQTVEYFIRTSGVREFDGKNDISNESVEENAQQYNTSWEDYFVVRPDNELQSQSEAMIIDICYCLEVPDDNSTRISEVGSDLELSGLRERHKLRVFCNNLQFKYGSSASHIADKLKEYTAQYSYPPYLEEKPIPTYNQLSPPSSEDYESLMAEVPLRRYVLEMRGTIIEYDIADHSTDEKQTNRLRGTNPSLIVGACRMEYVTPFYPNRLVFTTCQLPQPPMKLFNMCYQRLDATLSDMNVKLGDTIMSRIPSVEGYSREIIYPSLWIDSNVLIKDQDVHVPQMEILNIGMQTIGIFNDMIFGTDWIEQSSKQDEQKEIKIMLQKLNLAKFQTNHTMVQQVKLQSFDGEIRNDKSAKCENIIRSFPFKETDNLLDLLIQTPLDEDNINPCIVMLNLGELKLVCNNFIIDLVAIIKRPQHKKIFKKLSLEEEEPKAPVRKQSTNKDRPMSRRSETIGLESVHSSSEKNATVVVPNIAKQETVKGPPFQLRRLFDRYKTKIISCDIKCLTVQLDFTRGECVQVIRFPEIVMTTTGGRIGELKRKVPISNEALDIVDKMRNFFPWTFQFIDFSCDMIRSGRTFSVIDKLKSNVTLLISEKQLEEAKESGNSSSAEYAMRETLEVVLHVDTTSIVFNLSEEAVNFLYLNWRTLQQWDIFKSYSPAKSSFQDSRVEIAKRPISPDSSFDLNKLFDSAETMDTRDDSCTDITEIQTESFEVVSSIWMQLAFEKFHVNLFTRAESTNLSIKAEDIICSFDQKKAYLKFRTRIGSVSGKLMRRSGESNEWQTDESLSVTGRNNDSSAFVDLTVTRAETGIVHSKWGVKRKHRYMNNQLIEVMLKVQNLDCKLDVDQMTGFLRIFDALSTENQKTIHNSTKDDSVTSVSDLPLVFIESKGIQIYLPTGGKSSSNVLIWKIQSIIITPTVENPLTRNPVRADIYTKATQLGILNLPGSKIEDRQYGIQFKQMSLETADWKEMLNYMESIGHGYENPALEWNNPTKGQMLEICEVFNDFNCTIVVAPAIVFTNILVCGPSIEMNCVSDLNVKIRTDQFEGLMSAKSSLGRLTRREIKQKSLRQMACLFSDKSLYNGLKMKKETKNPQPMVTGESRHFIDSKRLEKDSSKSDSGISSLKVLKKGQGKPVLKHYKMNIPYDVTFLGGNFFISLHTNAKARSLQEVEEKEMNSFDSPLVKLFLYQPNFSLTQSIYDRTVNIGIFNIAVQLPDEDNTDEVFNSQQGKLNSALGIPPSVLKLKLTESVTKERILTINLFRPMKLKASQRILRKIDALSKSLITIENPSLERKIATIPRKFIETTKANLFGCTKLSFSISQLECIYEHKMTELNMIVRQLSANCLIQERPDRMTIETLIKGIALKTNELTLLHPTSWTGTLSIVTEFWQRSPVITISVACNFIQVDMGPKNIIFLKKILESIERESKKNADVEHKNVSMKKRPTDAIEMHMPKFTMETNEEYYQDDLRAGAFQFVEISSDRNLPLSYQIQVINRKDNRVICWKYPQARALLNVEILPVPYNIVSSTNVKCCLEYYSESRGEFMSYSEFSLSESQIQKLKLPKKITATVWRVVMRPPTVLVDGKLFEEESSSIEDDLATSGAERAPLVYNINDILHTAEDDGQDGAVDNIMTLHPNVLIACMKVDSYFNPALIANCNFFFNVNNLEINVINQLVEDQFTLPGVVANYKGPCNVLPLNQHVCQIKLDNLKLGSHIFDDLNLNIQLDFGFEMNYVDYSYLLLMPFVEHFKFQCYYDWTEEKLQVINFLIDNSLKIRSNPSIVHTLTTMSQIWNQSLGATASNYLPKELVIMTRIIICNSTNAVIYYGQMDTVEMYPVLPRGFDFYAFRSVKSSQSLCFALDGVSGRVHANPCPIVDDGEQYLRIGDSFMVITIKSISSTQRLITVRGQMEIFNLSREKFVVEIGSEEQKPLMVLDKSASIISPRNLEELKVLRICFENIGHWSGDIPIRPSGKRLPWLVKVPVARNKYLSYWIRIVKCKQGEFTRLLVIVLPLYLVRSFLPKDTIVEELKLQKTCQIFGMGALNELHLMGTHDEEHILKFNENFQTAMGQDKSEILLSYKAMDVDKMFPSLDQEILNVDQLIKRFEGFTYEAKEWPMKCELESNITRVVSEAEHFVPLCDFGSLLADEPIFNSLVLEVAPWCLFINGSGLNVFLKSGNTRKMYIGANQLGTPFDFIDNKFTIQFVVNETIILESPEISLVSHATKKELVLIDGEVLLLEVNSGDGKYLLKTIVSSLKENNRRVIVLSSQYVFVNYTHMDLSLFVINVPTSTDKNMCFSKGLFPSPEIGSYKLIGAGEDLKLGSVKGLSLPIINNEFISKKKSKKETRLQYLILEFEGPDMCPINITEPFTRKTVNFPSAENPMSLILSLSKDKEQFFISVIEEYAPDIEFHNKTDFNLCVGQSESLTKMTGPVRECEHFQWFQSLPGKHKVNFSPSVMYKNYPQLTSNSCGIILAIDPLDGSPLKWSQPFAFLEPGECHIALPTKNDVKVTIRSDYQTRMIAIETVNTSQEFSLRNVRSRLLHPIAEDNERNPTVEVVNETELMDQEGEAEGNQINYQFTIFVREIGVFIAAEDKSRGWTKYDVVSLTMDDVVVAFDSATRRFNLETGNIQIDNQLTHTGSYDFPVVFCADSEISPMDFPGSVFNLNELVRDKMTNSLFKLAIKLYTKELVIEELECSVKPIRLYLEDTYLSRLGDVIMEFLPQNAVYSSEVAVAKEMLNTPSQVVIPRRQELLTRSLARPLNMKVFKIGNIDVLVSLHTSTRFYIALDHSPLSFSAFERVNLRTTDMKLGASMSMHYLSGAIFGAGWMLGSLEILGSPSGLARSVTTGLKDFVSKPVEGLFQGPWEFMLGFSLGSMSLVRNITAGTVNSVTKLATSVARNLDRLTLDDEHVQRTDLVRRFRPHGVAEGFTHGLTEFGITLLGAIGGIARHTMAARTPGQVLSGVGKGLMGVILKPISGAAEFVAFAGNGVLHSVGYNTLPSCRSVSVTQGVLSPSQCQLSWKILQPIMNTNQILFTHIVTLMEENALVPVLFGFSETVVILINLLTDEVNLFGISVVHPHIDASDGTMVHLNIVSKIPATEDNEQFLKFHHIASRVREYIQSSREHLPTTATDDVGSLDLTPEIPIVEGFVIDRTISFYVKSELAQHIFNYMSFLRHYNHERYSS